MRAELKGLQILDGCLLLQIEEFFPEDPVSFAVGVTALVGPAGQPGEELFQFVVGTPKWLTSESFEKGFRWGRTHLFVSRWDATLILRIFQDLCRHAEGPDWKTIATKLSRYGHWEFEDYRESM